MILVFRCSEKRMEETQQREKIRDDTSFRSKVRLLQQSLVASQC
ncbi:hypothetical protein Lalb_Chr15g0080051 [Lupinus albus]|uniref:Uncharacterized protein n=1 Tax=Lupinus albus TaxID=3870 RepID=A0A6A4P9F8_LUPAL|nr:hypothetical protein Lalb_Chr15g0080051 [Lupinus albus]